MDGRHFVIYEPNLSDLGVFDSRDDALTYVEALLAVNTDDFLDDLTVSDESGPVLYEESLRQELQHRAARRESVGSRGGSSEGLGTSGYRYPPMAATSFD